MNIIRKYKIHLLNIEDLTEKKLTDLNIIFKSVNYTKENFEVINFIYNNMFNLKQVKLKEYSNDIFYFKDDKIIFIYHLKDNFFSFNYYLIWRVFQDKFKYSRDKTSGLIKCIIEDAYNLSSIRPYILNYNIEK